VPLYNDEQLPKETEDFGQQELSRLIAMIISMTGVF
jgi:hypothetical protein